MHLEQKERLRLSRSGKKRTVLFLIFVSCDLDGIWIVDKLAQMRRQTFNQLLAALAVCDIL